MWRDTWRDKEERNKLIKFLIVGGANTLVMYALYLWLLHLGLGYVVAITVDYGFGICLGYVLQRRWTFKSHGKPSLSFLKYCVSYVGVYLLNLALLVGFVELFGLGEKIAQVPAIAIATVASYSVQRIWVFKPA